MKFTLTTILVTLSGMARAVPRPESRSVPLNALEARWVNACEDSSFINQSSEGSPRVDDCLQIIRNIGYGEVYLLSLDTQHELATFGNCAIGAYSPFIRGVTNVRVGGQDVIDLINDSVRNFQWNGLVGAKGEMRCKVDPDNLDHLQNVQWGIYYKQ
ncbi:putative necrosis-inducing factor-domain-containing protein [Panaeolus papilionaceus]|nr:putative necrosis-inducing factor-domain-containing protein [Panaeolus papilionaceus]